MYVAKHLNENPKDLVLVSDDGIDHSLKSKLMKLFSHTYHYLMYDEELMKKFDEENKTHWNGTFDARPRIKRIEELFTV